MAQVLPSGMAAVSQGGTTVPSPVWVSVQPGVPLGLGEQKSRPPARGGPNCPRCRLEDGILRPVWLLGTGPPGEPWFTDSLSQETSPQ